MTTFNAANLLNDIQAYRANIEEVIDNNETIEFGYTELDQQLIAAIKEDNAMNTTNINNEVNGLVLEARDRIGVQQAMIQFVNRNLAKMPVLVGGNNKVQYQDSKGRTLTKVQENNSSLWLIALDVLGFNEHVSGKLLASAFMGWTKENGFDLPADKAEVLGVRFIKAMQDLEYINKDIVTKEVQLVDGSVIKAKGSTISEAFYAELNVIIEEMREKASMVCRPLRNQPMDWVDMDNGIADNAGIRLINNCKLRTNRVAPKVLEAVNKLQATPYRVNPVIIEAAKDMRTNRHLYINQLKGQFKAKEISQEAFSIYNEILNYAEGEVFFPITMDTRGRIYMRGGLLSPQSVDFLKAAFMFAEEAPIGKHGLVAMMIEAANTLGKDKLSKVARVNWVRANMDKIRQINTHRDVRDLFPSADTFQALVICRELNRVMSHSNPEEVMSGIVVRMDGTCNGLQHSAAITGDRATAHAVNCDAATAKDAPRDIYGIVAKASEAFAEGEVLEVIKSQGRKLAKGFVMVKSYGGSQATLEANIAKYLETNGLNVSLAKAIGEAYKAGMNVEAGAVEQLTEALQMGVTDSLRASVLTKSVIKWVTADGFVAATEYLADEINKVRVGRLCATMYTEDKADVDEVKSANAMSPNLVHSIDATHLRMVVRAADFPVLTVHDSYACRPCDYMELSRLVREKFAVCHAHDHLGSLYANLEQPAPEFIKDYTAREALQACNIFG